MKKIFLTVGLIFGGLVTSAQTTSVTATITDSDSQTWNNGTWTAVLMNIANPNGPYYLDGVQLTAAQLQKSGSMSSSGVITGTFYDTVNHITPNGSVYLFTLCPNASAPCVSNIGASPTGSSINLSTTLSANLAGPRFAATGANKFGYLDAEINPTPVSGGVYYNVTIGFQRIWSGAAWSNNGSGAGGPPTGAAGGDLSGTYPNPGVAKVNGGAIPLSKTVVGTNSSGQIVDAGAATLANNTTGNAATATALAATPSTCPANQATVAISANGTPTCATIPTLAGYTPAGAATTPNSTLTLANWGSSATPTMDINLGNANTWTGLQTFTASIPLTGTTATAPTTGFYTSSGPVANWVLGTSPSDFISMAEGGAGTGETVTFGSSYGLKLCLINSGCAAVIQRNGSSLSYSANLTLNFSTAPTGTTSPAINLATSNNGNANASGGNINLTAGNGTGTGSSNGGNINLTPGASTNGAAGTVIVNGGTNVVYRCTGGTLGGVLVFGSAGATACTTGTGTTTATSLTVN